MANEEALAWLRSRYPFCDEILRELKIGLADVPGLFDMLLAKAVEDAGEG